MKPLVEMTVLGLLILLPTAATAGSDEVTHCITGSFRPFHDSKELPELTTFVLNGILFADRGGGLFHGMATHGEGVQRGRGKEKAGMVLLKWVDKDGDIIVVESVFNGNLGTGNPKFVMGTGKWKGISGGYTTSVVAHSGGATPQSWSGCRRLKITYQFGK